MPNTIPLSSYPALPIYPSLYPTHVEPHSIPRKGKKEKVGGIPKEFHSMIKPRKQRLSHFIVRWGLCTCHVRVQGCPHPKNNHHQFMSSQEHLTFTCQPQHTPERRTTRQYSSEIRFGDRSLNLLSCPPLSFSFIPNHPPHPPQLLCPSDFPDFCS